MARTKQTKKVKLFGSPKRKFFNKPAPTQTIVKAKAKSLEKKKSRKAASSHINQRIGFFKSEDIEAAVNMYRASRLPGYKGKPLSLSTVVDHFKDKHITFGSLQKRISGEVTSMGPSSGGKGCPRILPRDVEAK